MNPGKSLITCGGLIIILLLIVSSIPIQKKIDNTVSNKDIIKKTLYLKSSTLKRLSLGYNELLADIYWIRALQFLSIASQNYDDAQELFKYFDLITDLDPKFVNAYRYGGTFLADKPPLGLGEVELGINLLDKGRKSNPQNFKIVLDEAFIYFLYTTDYKTAAKLFNEASEKDNLSEFRKASFKGMAALSLSKAGNKKLSKQIWSYIYKNSEDEGRKKFALQNLIKIHTQENEDILTDALRKYHNDTNSAPDNIQVLFDKGYSKAIKNYEEYGDEYVILKDTLVVRNKKLAEEQYNNAVSFLNSRSSKFKNLYDRYPRDLEELKSYVNQSDLIKYPEHPYQGEFIYDSSTGRIK